MRRREFITLVGSAAAGWPLAARAQQPAQVRRIGVLMPLAENDPVGQARIAAFVQGLQQSGWTDGRNVRIDYRWSEGDANRIRSLAIELIALGPDVIMASTSAAVAPLRQVTSTVPIVFAVVADPVGAGFVAFEYGLSAKWLELLKEIAPRVTRAGIIRDPALASGPSQFAAMQSMAPSLAVEVSPVNVRDASEIERAIAAFARSANGGLIVTASPLAAVHRDLIIALAAQHKLPAIYYERSYATAGGLISYGPDFGDQYRRAAGYVDRILKGEKPADLPVQAPIKYELAINLKTAKALGLEVPATVLARADEVIE
jgi:ABC-type uncharacterized transport system substrate-binding protein